MTACAIPGCESSADSEAPLPLCRAHLEQAADAVPREPREDLLPSRCLACGSPVGRRYPGGWVCAVCEWRYGEAPDDELPPPRVDVVYYVRYADRVKIGTTASPRRRFAAIRHEEVLAFERGDRRLEARRHAQFAALRFPGSEWFRLGPELAEHIADVAGGVDPWDRWARWVSTAMALRG